MRVRLLQGKVAGAASRADSAATKVVESFESPEGNYCVDIFARAEGTFGLEEYRRDPEDMRGWFPLHRHPGLAFPTPGDALAHARATVPWMFEK